MVSIMMFQSLPGILKNLDLESHLPPQDVVVGISFLFQVIDQLLQLFGIIKLSEICFVRWNYIRVVNDPVHNGICLCAST